MVLAGTVIAILLQVYLGLMVVRMVLSWIPVVAPHWEPQGLLLVLFEAVYTVTDPPIRFFTRLLPNVQTAGISFSLGYMAAFIVIILLQRLNALVLLS